MLTLVGKVKNSEKPTFERIVLPGTWFARIFVCADDVAKAIVVDCPKDDDATNIYTSLIDMRVATPGVDQDFYSQLATASNTERYMTGSESHQLIMHDEEVGSFGLVIKRLPLIPGHVDFDPHAYPN